jgi:hypothetical protein
MLQKRTCPSLLRTASEESLHRVVHAFRNSHCQWLFLPGPGLLAKTCAQACLRLAAAVQPDCQTRNTFVLPSRNPILHAS